MKKLTQIVIATQFVLMLTHCATSTDELYAEYTACREQTASHKITELGVVTIHPGGAPVMVYEAGACPDELAKWKRSDALREKRRRERAAIQANACPRGTTRWCNTRGASDSTCGCVSNSEVRDALRGLSY